MKKLASVLFAAALSLGFMATTASADVAKGQKLVVKKLKKACKQSGVANGAELSAKHTQAEWKKINDEGKLAEELKRICPKSKPLKKKHLTHIYDFLYNYASDSGNVPSC